MCTVLKCILALRYFHLTIGLLELKPGVIMSVWSFVGFLNLKAPLLFTGRFETLSVGYSVSRCLCITSLFSGMPSGPMGSWLPIARPGQTQSEGQPKREPSRNCWKTSPVYFDLPYAVYFHFPTLNSVRGGNIVNIVTNSHYKMHFKAWLDNRMPSMGSSRSSTLFRRPKPTSIFSM